MPELKRLLLAMACVVGGLLATRDAAALPRFALQKGTDCLTCHTNPAGGGLRNQYGVEVFGTTELSAKRKSAIKTFVTESLQLGGDFRSQSYAYSDEMPGETIPSDTTMETSHGYFVMQTDLYANWQLSDTLSMYIEQDVLRGTREAFGMWREGEVFVKVGAFQPNYGLRVDDHTAFIRGGNPRAAQAGIIDGLIWEPNFADAGIEIWAEVAEIKWTVGAFNGGIQPTTPDFDNDRALLARGETHLGLGGVNTMIGANVFTNKNVDLDSTMMIAGGFLGVGGNKWTLMGEVDMAKNYLALAADPLEGATSLAVFGEAAYDVSKGWTVLARYEFFDPDLDFESGKVTRFSIGAEIFPVPYLEIKPTFRLTDQPKTPETSIESLLQAHLWF